MIKECQNKESEKNIFKRNKVCFKLTHRRVFLYKIFVKNSKVFAQLRDIQEKLIDKTLI